MTKALEGDALEAKLCEMLDYIVQRPKLQAASRYAGYNPKHIWTLLKRSSEGDPRYLVRWPDRDSEQRIQFCEAVVLARRYWKVQYDATLREEVDIGVPRPQTFAGEQIWEKDPQLLTEWGGDTMEAAEAAWRLGGIKDYPYKHRMGPNGLERVPLVIYEPAPGALRQHIARSLLPTEYNPPEHRITDTQHSGAVLILNANKPAYAKDYVPAESPMRMDLHQRLAELRAKGPQHKHPLDKDGRKTIPKIGNGSTSNDPPERQGYGPAPTVDADGHVRGTKAIPMIARDGTPAPGGFSAITGKPT